MGVREKGIEGGDRGGGDDDDELGFGGMVGVGGGRAGAMCSALARAGLVPGLVATLASLNTASNEEAGVGPGVVPGGGGGSGGNNNPGNSPAAAAAAPAAASSSSFSSSSVSSKYREDVADLLLSATRANHRGGANVRAAVCELPVLHGLLALVGSPLPKTTSAKLLSMIRHLSRDAAALDPLQRAGAIPKLVRFLQWEDDGTRECAMRALYNLCRGSKARLEQAAVAGGVPHLIAIAAAGSGYELSDNDNSVNGGRATNGNGVGVGVGVGGVGVVNGANGDGAHWTRHAASAALLMPLAVPLLCDMASSSRRTRAELAKHDALDAYLSLARGGDGGGGRGGGGGEGFAEYAVLAVEAIAAWLSEEPWKVEARLMEPDAVAAIAAVMEPKRTPAPSVDLLNALLRLLSKSPRVCAGLANGGAIAPLVEALGPPSGTSGTNTNTGTSPAKSSSTSTPSSPIVPSSSSFSSPGSARRKNILTRHRDRGAAAGDNKEDPVRSLAFVRLLAALYDHHSRPKELIVRYDLAGRLRHLCAVAPAGGGSTGGARGGGEGENMTEREEDEEDEEDEEEEDEEAAAAAALQAAAAKLLSGMRLNKL